MAESKTNSYYIEGYVETISSNGEFTIRGADGYYLEREITKKNGEKEKKQYNVFWNDKGEAKCQLLKSFLPSEQIDRILQILCSAKSNHQKIEMEMNGNSLTKIKKVTLLK